MLFTKRLLNINTQEIACEYVLRERNAIILHGAGASNRARYYTFAEEIVKHGYGVVLFDFMGHGESTGQLQDSSLGDRQEQATKIIETLLPPDSRFILIGFSMSGETVCNLLPQFPKRVKTILLGCPAIYTQKATDLAFKDGHFKPLIRAQDSWRDSRALRNLAEFEGRTFIAYGSKDEVIPKEVVDALRTTAKNCTYRQYEDVSHALAVWLSNHPANLSNLVAEIIEADSKAE